MRAITIQQPLAQLIALRATPYVTQSWMTHYRGPIAIHASKEFPRAARQLCRCEPYATALIGNEDLPTGCVVAICDLAAVIKTAPEADGLFEEVADFPEYDRQFGDFSPGRFAWLFQRTRALENPIPARGATSLWEWDESTLGLLLPTPTPATRGELIRVTKPNENQDLTRRPAANQTSLHFRNSSRGGIFLHQRRGS